MYHRIFLANVIFSKTPGNMVEGTGLFFICVCVCLYVCVLMPPHFTITCFRFRAKRIDGVNVVYFRITHFLCIQRYVDDVFLYCVLKANEVLVTVCVIVLLCVLYMG